MNDVPVIGVHLDLKYMMPSKSYLNRWVRRLPGWGINTLLIEYEDKFPFRKYPFLQAEGAFTDVELDEFLAAARGVGLRVIPLVQSLSHLEFALSHEELAHLRETPAIPTQIDPRNPEAVAFVNDLIDEMLAFHTADEFFHVGGDEAWHLGHSERNRSYVRRLGKVRAWAEHEGPILRRLVSLGKRPIVWDDIFWRKPERIRDVDLPRETVLHSWDYGIRRLKDSSSLDRVSVYGQAGYDVLGGPCLNWGVMTPRHEHCLDNTSAWAGKARQAGLMGLINTAWACFHVLPHAQALHIAATSECMKNGSSSADRAWQETFLADEYGTSGDGLSEAMSDLGRTWEHAVRGMARPITPILYGYMDLVLHYGDIDRRKAEGAYPLDWGRVDFDGLYRRKLQLLRETLDRDAAVKRLDTLEKHFHRAADAFGRLAARAAKRRQEAAYLSLAADMKLLHTQIMRQEILGARDAGLLDAWRDLKPRFEQVLGPFMEPSAVQRALTLWWAPTLRAGEDDPADGSPSASPAGPHLQPS